MSHSFAIPSTESDSPEAAVARTGYWHGRAGRVVYVLGRRQLGWNSTTALGDCAQYLDTTQDRLNDVVGGSTYYIVSTSTDDDGNPVGSGARTVRIVYLDSAGAQQLTTVTLDGTTVPIQYDATFADLAQWDPSGFEADAVSIGQTARVTETEPSITTTGRILELNRDWLHPDRSRLSITNAPRDLTALLVGARALSAAGTDSTTNLSGARVL